MNRKSKPEIKLVVIKISPMAEVRTINFSRVERLVG
jgi:hypothetical protein